MKDRKQVDEILGWIASINGWLDILIKSHIHGNSDGRREALKHISSCIEEIESLTKEREKNDNGC